MKKRLALILLVLATVLALTACFNSIANKKVESITVTGGLPTEVEVGKAPDFSGISLEVKYNDGQTKSIGYSDVTVQMPDTSKIGKAKYTVTYDGFSIELQITVTPSQDSGGIVTNATLQKVTYLSGIPTEIFLGADFHTTDLKLTAHYSDGSTRTITSDKLTIVQNIKFDEASDVGTQTLIVEYQGKRCEIDILVKAIEATRLTLDTQNFVNEILIGGTIDTSKITGILHYNNSTQKTIENSDIVFGSIDTSTAGTKTLTGTYGGFTGECNITVLGVKSISVTGFSDKVKPGADVDLSLISVKVTASNNAVYSIDKALVTVDKSKYDSTLIGTDRKTTTLTFKFGGASLDVSITVEATRDDAALAGVEYIGGVDSEIFVGEQFDDTDISAKANLTYGFSDMLTKDKLTVSGTVNSAVAGTYTLTYSYTLGGVTKSFPLTVTVVEPTPTDLVLNTADLGWVIKGETLDVSSITATLKYNYAGKTTSLANSDLTITNTATDNAGEFEVTVAYGGITAKAAYTVVTATSIEVESGFRGTVTLGNSAYDDNLIAKITLSNGEGVYRTQAQGLSVDDAAYDSTAVGQTSVTLLFGDASAVVTVNVVLDMDELVLESIAIQPGLPTSIFAGDSYDYSALKITAYFNYNITEGYTIADGVSVETEGSTATAGTYKIIASYTHGGVTKTAELSVEVKAVEPTELVINTYDSSVLLGDSYKTSNITATLKYNNGTQTVLSAEDLSFAIDVTRAGAATLTVTHTASGKSANADVTVVGISSVIFNGVASSYRVNNLTIDTSAITITITGTDGKVYTRPFGANAALPTLSLDNTLGEQTKEYTFTYLDAEYKQSIRVYAEFEDAALLGIVYNGVYEMFIGDAYAGKIQVLANYTYGFTRTYDIDDGVTVSGLNTTAKGNYNVTVEYGGKSTTATISVVYPKVTNIVINSNPLAIKGEAYDYNSINVTITLENNKTLTAALADLADYEISASLDTSAAGTAALTLSANGKNYTASVTVYEIEKVIVDTEGFYTIVAPESTFTTEGLSKILVYLVGRQEPEIRYTQSFNHNVNTSLPGKYTLTATYLGTVSEAVEIIVAEQNFIITDTIAPEPIIKWQNGTNSQKFLDSGYAYAVGDDNPFKFELSFSMFDLINEVVKDGSIVYVSSSSVTLNGAVVGEEYVTIDETKHTFDFTEAAIGKSFVITTAHADYPTQTKSITVTVVDGYNVFDELELNLLTNRDYNIGDVGIYQMQVLYTFLKNNQVAGIENMTYEQYVSFVNGIKGIVLHDDLAPTTGDLPSEYFFELSDGTKYLWNNQHIYPRAHTDASKYNDASVSSPSVFNVYGNYFTVYSYNIPTVAPAGSIDKYGVTTNSDGLSTSQLFSFDISSTIGYLIDENNSFYHKNYVTNFYAFGMRDDNPSVAIQPELAQIRSKLGVIGLKVRNGEYNLNSVNSEAFFISFFPDYNDVTANVDYCTFYNAWNSHIMTYPDNMYDTDSNGNFDGSLHAGAAPATVNISNSFIGKAGGPAILNMIANPESGENKGMDIVINIDANSNVFSYVKGSESWFESFGATTLAEQILGMNAFFEAKGSSYVTGVGGQNFMNMICVNIDASFMPPNTGTTTDLNVTVNVGGQPKLDMTSNGSTNYGHGGIVDAIFAGAEQGQLPVFVSDNIYAGTYWGACYTDGATGIFDAYAKQNETLAGLELYKGGNYLSLYYYNLGILFKYNEASHNTEPAPADCTVTKITASHGYN